MKNLTSKELRELYLRFFRERGHTVIPSASLIPENDPTVLFTTAGMHPLVPYLMGETHPAGSRLVDVQKCVRTGDIDEVGDSSHCTFFEMLGNWSLGDYFKQDSIAYSWEFLTDEKWLGIDKDRLYFTCFEGDENAPRDTESHDRWVEMGVDPSHIFYLGAKHNWWIPGSAGPCGPDTEIFFDTGKPKCSEGCNPSCDCGKYLEIWNNVFMQYYKPEGGKVEPLAKRNVDTGMGLDRTIATLQGVESVYDTDAFTGIIAKIAVLSGKGYKDSPETVRAFRIIADHVRCATFILGDPRGVTPSNVDQGYILRRLIRRAIRYAMQLGMAEDSLKHVAEAVIAQYGEFYTELSANQDKIMTELSREEQRFQKTLKNGIREFERIKGSFADGGIDGPPLSACMTPSVSPLSSLRRWRMKTASQWMSKGSRPHLRNTKRNPRPARSNASRAALRMQVKQQRACILQRICCRPLCARYWATASPNAAAISPRSACALTSALNARLRRTSSGK